MYPAVIRVNSLSGHVGYEGDLAATSVTPLIARIDLADLGKNSFALMRGLTLESGSYWIWG